MVETPVKINSLKGFLLPRTLQNLASISIWSFNETKDNRKIWGKIEKSDIVLFLRNRKFFSKGKVLHKMNNQKIPKKIPRDLTFLKTRKLIIFIKDLQPIDIDLEAAIPIFVNPIMPHAYNFPIKLIQKNKSKMLKNTFGNIENAIKFLGDPKNKDRSILDIINASKLKNQVSFKVENTIIKQRKGQEAFRKNVLTNFGNRCAVCNNSQIDLLDAGHIIPIEGKKTSGLLKNGISFCVLCHKMFDNGYFSFDDNFKIIFSKRKKIDNVLKNLIRENKKMGKCLVYPSRDYLLLHRIKFGIV